MHFFGCFLTDFGYIYLPERRRMGLPRRAGVRAPGLVPIRIQRLHGAVMQPEPHTQPRAHTAIDLKSTSERSQNHVMFVCCSLDGYSFSPASRMRLLGEY